MNFKEAKEKLQKYNQTHLLDYFDELTELEKGKLLSQIEQLDFSVIASLKTKNEKQKKGEITPLAAMRQEEILSREEYFCNIGKKAIKQGKIGALLLAGGMGTRLGSDAPKGMFDIGVTKPVYIFERLFENLLDVVKETDTWVHLFIMTSDTNHDITVEFLEEKEFFGYNKDFVTFFVQEMSPATDFDGQVLLEEKGKIAASPNGNGGWFASMNNCNILYKVYDAGIEWINVFAVDNVLQRIADPCFVGATLDSGCAVGSKVVKKAAPDEKVGVMCLEDGKPSIIEYYELTEKLMQEKDEMGEPAYNYGVILNYLFKVKDLEEMMHKQMPIHVVEKKITCLDKEGNTVLQERPNGYKFETLALDMIHLSKDCLPFEVNRKKEFAPIKNKAGVDSVETARELLKWNQIII